MKASRYMKPPSCHKPARVTVRDAGPALGRPETHQDTQHAAHLIGEIRASERGWEVTKGTTSPCPSRVNRVTLTEDRRLPIFPRERTSSRPVGMSQTCRKPKLREWRHLARSGRSV